MTIKILIQNRITLDYQRLYCIKKSSVWKKIIYRGVIIESDMKKL